MRLRFRDRFGSTTMLVSAFLTSTSIRSLLSANVAVEAADGEPASVRREALDPIPAALEHAADPAVTAVEHVHVDIDAVALRRRERNEVAVAADIAEIVLDVVLDDQGSWFAAAAIDQPELIHLVTAMIDSNNDVVGARDVACGGDGFGEECQLDEVATFGWEAVHLQAAGVIAPDEQLLAVW